MTSTESLNAFSMDFFSLKGKTAIVTGGNRGLGQAFAVAMAKAGANLFIAGISSENVRTRELIEAQGVEVEFLSVDIAAEGVPQQIINACCQHFGSLDILVNNAGICKLNKVERFGRDDWDPMINVNLTAAFELSHEAAKIMIPRRSGKIINVCSVFSSLGGRWSPAYSATKHALAGLTKAYCDELGQYNIQVNGIAPGYYETDITAITRSTPKEYKRVLEHIPANRWGDPQDLMGAMIFLASRASDYVNGHILAVDGGYLVR
ncbi:SDR family oxidoreductase [Enterobacteriaceae bacterium H4N4]|uniref:SDR family oxidoreductase n=1 Tax=Silvania confinis TaxID=2926470 RepID=A0A9J6QGJ2_9ENTR|nr:SDR family oxidoreductase [Silvania confinis]MCU6668510.1 SDR family oxidoreductase [Silvania confinis]